MQVHHPQYLEWVGAVESARLLGCAPSEWIRSLTRLQTLNAVRQLQRDAYLMTSNLSVQNQYALSLHGTGWNWWSVVTTSCLRLWMMPCQCCMFSVLPHTWRLWASGVLHTVLVGQPMTSSIRTLLVPVVLPVCHRCPVGSWFFSSWQRELLMG